MAIRLFIFLFFFCIVDADYIGVLKLCFHYDIHLPKTIIILHTTKCFIFLFENIIFIQREIFCAN